MVSDDGDSGESDEERSYTTIADLEGSASGKNTDDTATTDEDDLPPMPVEWGGRAFLFGWTLFYTLGIFYFAFVFFFALQRISRLNIPFGGDNVLLVFIGGIVTVAIVSLILLLELNGVQFRLEGAGIDTPISLIKAFNLSMQGNILPKTAAFFCGVAAGVSLLSLGVRNLLSGVVQFTIGYTLIAGLSAAAAIAIVNLFFDSIPFTDIVDPRLFIADPLFGSISLVSIPLIYGTGGIFVGYVLKMLNITIGELR